MTAYPLGVVRFRAFDKNGQPLIGGQVFAYEAGSTSVEKDTYLDKSAQHLNTWPVVLDDAGSAAIYISGDYYLQIFDAEGNLIEEGDGIADAESIAVGVMNGSSGGAADLQQRVSDLEFARDEHTDQINALTDQVTDLKDQLKAEIDTERNKAIKTAIDTAKATLTEEFTEKLADAVSEFNRTVEQLRIKVGGVFISLIEENPATQLGYGTWQLVSKGQAIVGLSDNVLDPTWVKTVGMTFGSYDETLTIEQIPAHDHTGVVNASNESYAGGNGTRFTSDGKSNKTGGGKSHNNVQPSMVFAIWKRTA